MPESRATRLQQEVVCRLYLPRTEPGCSEDIEGGRVVDARDPLLMEGGLLRPATLGGARHLPHLGDYGDIRQEGYAAAVRRPSGAVGGPGLR